MEYPIQMMDSIADTLAVPSSRAIFAFCCCLLIIAISELILVQKIVKAGRLSWLGVDPEVVSLVRRPLYLQIFVWSFVWSLQELLPNASYTPKISATLYSLNYVVWALAISALATRSLTRLSKVKNRFHFLDDQTLGMFLIIMRILVWSLAVYLGFKAWSIDLTGWLASAGALGLIFGFAAKDTLANLVAGLAILADRTYKVGDFVEVDNQYRGRVSRIGMRATLLQSVDGIQIVIPNSLLSSGYVINETAGPSLSHRVSIPISVAYGSDLEQCVEILETAMKALPAITKVADTRVLVSSLGESGIDISMLVWLENSAHRELVIDVALRRAYAALNNAGISIPFNQLDVHLVSGESGSAATTSADDA